MDSGLCVVEVDGRLFAQQEHLGFGVYSAVDFALMFHKGIPLPEGEVMIDDFTGAGSIWTVRRDAASIWVTKNHGTPDLSNGCYVQMIKQFGGRFLIKPSPGYEFGRV